MMNAQLQVPLAPELALFALAVLVLLAGLIKPGRAIGWIAFIGLLLVFGLMHYAPEGQVLFGGAYVQDALALFAKRLFVGATALSLLGAALIFARLTYDRIGPFALTFLAIAVPATTWALLVGRQR